MTVPDDALGDTATRTLAAVLAEPWPTVASVAAAVGRSKARTHVHLVRLRRLGLVAWEDGKDGTLRATVRPVPFGVEPPC